MNRGCLFLISVLFMLAALTASVSAQVGGVDPGYLRFACTLGCSVPDAEYYPLNNASWSNRAHTYDEITTCVGWCTRDPAADQVTFAKITANVCAKCPNLAACTELKPAVKAACVAIAKKRDLVEFGLNVKKDDFTGCPAGARLSEDGSTCTCPEGTEYDNLHTVCLNAKRIKGGLNDLLSLVPDDILVDLAEKNAPPDLRATLTAAKQTGLSGFFEVVSGQSTADLIRSYLTNLAYDGLVKDTIKLKQIIKTLGRTRTEALIQALKLVTGRSGATTTTPVPSETPVARTGVCSDPNSDSCRNAVRNAKALCSDPGDPCHKECGDENLVCYKAVAAVYDKCRKETLASCETAGVDFSKGYHCGGLTCTPQSPCEFYAAQASEIKVIMERCGDATQKAENKKCGDAYDLCSVERKKRYYEILRGGTG